jgi:secreted PhoX family phosphatase
MEEYLGYFGNAYRYGYIVEIADPQSVDPTPVKHYAMGRFSHENAVVMPDRRTVYMSDDGTGTVFFKFVADEAGDLSAGTLYAARAKMQGRGDDLADVAFKLDWIELAHATDEQVERWIAEYDGQEPSPNPNYVTDEEVAAWARGEADDDRAAFLESRKAAAALGATDEFRKMEGVNVKRGARPGDYLYMAMSEVNNTMLDNEATTYDDPQDDLRLERNDYGAVYRMRLDGNYDVRRMEPVIVGGPEANICGGCPYDASPNSKSTVCRDCAFNPAAEHDATATDAESGTAKGIQKATKAAAGLAGRGLSKLTETSATVDPENAIANPDNLVVMPDGRVIVGEDSGLHRPNMLWIYAPKY